MNCFVSKDMMVTYRLQMGTGLSFERVCDLLPYFRNLGISHLYLSPCLKAAAGSTHGYDLDSMCFMVAHLSLEGPKIEFRVSLGCRPVVDRSRAAGFQPSPGDYSVRRIARRLPFQ